MIKRLLLLGLLAFATPEVFAAAGSMPAVTVTPAAGGGSTYSLNIQVLILMTVLSLLPAALLMMTSFTRIVIVLGLLRQALGTSQTPSNQILIGLSLFLTYFVMAPVFDKVYNDAAQPYLDGKMEFQPALTAASKPIRGFMLAQTRESSLMTFSKISGHGQTISLSACLPPLSSPASSPRHSRSDSSCSFPSW